MRAVHVIDEVSKEHYGLSALGSNVVNRFGQGNRVNALRVVDAPSLKGPVVRYTENFPGYFTFGQCFG